jgi:putative transcriptional regulator
MTARHHPDVVTMLSYAAGALSPAFAAVMSAHLSRCAECRQQLARAEVIGGHLLSRQTGLPLAEDAAGKLRARLATEPDDVAPAPPAEPVRHDPHALPEALRPYFGASLADVRWRWIAPGIHHVRAAGVTEDHLMLLRVAPGRSLPMHTHGGRELTMILSGAYDDTLGHFAAGDVADLDGETEHQPVTTPGLPCICVAATDAPLRFSGWFARTIQPLVPL